MVNRPKCPVCGKMLVVPAGPDNAPILLLGEFPGYNEQIKGYPFVSDMRNGKILAGDVLKAELGMVGIQMFSCRATNIWQHTKEDKECDLTWHVDTALQELTKDRKYVLAMGSDVSKILFHTNIMDLAGLVIHHDAYPDVKFIMSPNPASAFHGPIGEVRHALSVLAKEIQ